MKRRGEWGDDGEEWTGGDEEEGRGEGEQEIRSV